jgi:CheY-like chemotaxis protein
LRILVVDDDPLLLRSLRETLESDGHVIETASGGREGIDRFREAKEEGRVFNVVLTDLGMPFVDGRQVATAIKACSPATPIIMLTGWGQRLVAEGDMPAHVNIVLSKPPKLRDLREALGKSCASANG